MTFNRRWGRSANSKFKKFRADQGVGRLDAGEPPIIFGDGTQTMDMLHVHDVARANILAAISPASDVVLNVGSGTETSLYTLARQLAAVMGRGHSWLYALLARHRDLEWVMRIRDFSPVT